MTRTLLIYALLVVFTVIQSALMTELILETVLSKELIYFIMVFGTLESLYVSIYMTKTFERESFWAVEDERLVYLYHINESIYETLLYVNPAFWAVHVYGYYVQSKVMYESMMFLIIYFIVGVNISAFVSRDVFKTMSKSKN